MNTYPLDRTTPDTLHASMAVAEAAIAQARADGTFLRCNTGDDAVTLYRVGDTLPPDPPPGPEPLPTLPWRSFFDMLDTLQLRAAVDAWLVTAPQRARDEWGRTQSYEREHPLLVAAIAGMGLDPDAVDAAWLAQAEKDGIA